MIKFVYLDVGGVAIKDFSKNDKWEEMQKDMGVNESNRKEFEAWWQKYEKRICIDLDLDTKLKELGALGIKIEPKYSIVGDFVSRFEANKSLWPIIVEAKSRGGVGLLTNLYPRMYDLITKAGLWPAVSWDTIVDSSVEKCQKPDRKIFEIAQERCETKPQQILFVDNTRGHLEAAKKMGWQTFYYDSADYEKSSQLLEKYITENL